MSRGAPRERRPVDWDAVHRRLAVAEPTPAELADAAVRILQERAVRLAVTTDAADAERASLEVLTFERHGQSYAIESRFVIEVGKCGKLSQVPGAGRALLGLMNLRGDILPVFDLALLAESAAQRPPAPQLVVLGSETPDLAVLADSVDQVSRLPLSSLAAVSSVGVLPHPEYVRGITADARVLLDGDAVLRDRRVFVAKPAFGSARERD